MSKHYDYTAYGQSIKSEFQLPLPTGKPDSAPGLIIKTGCITEPGIFSKTWDQVLYHLYDNDFFIKWEQLGTFRISLGESIIVNPANPLHPSDQQITTPLLGTVMATALHQKGYTVLHGGAVMVDGQAVLFLGTKGAGKSTLTGYLMKQNYPVISDDVCPLYRKRNSSHFSLLPSFPRIKLWPNSMEFIGLAPKDHEKVHPDFEKRNIRLGGEYLGKETEVKAVIVLVNGDDLTMERTNGLSAIALLMPHLIINRFDESQPKSLQKTVYFQITDLIRQLPVYKLTRPRDLTLLPRISDLVLSTIIP